jgi:hypothetical protein
VQRVPRWHHGQSEEGWMLLCLFEFAVFYVFF